MCYHYISSGIGINTHNNIMSITKYSTGIRFNDSTMKYFDHKNSDFSKECRHVLIKYKKYKSGSTDRLKYINQDKIKITSFCTVLNSLT